jgi:hypothetical protein
MSVVKRRLCHHEASGASGPDLWAPTDGEINFLWSFIQGSIMIPETWNALLRSYGFCERHAWIHISIELAFRDEYLLGPMILYAELIEKALHAIDTPRPKLEVELRADGPCFICAMNLQDAFAGASPQARLDRARDASNLRDFASRLAPMWRSRICPECSGKTEAPMLCRRHLLAAAKAHAPTNLRAQRSVLRDLSERATRYQKSFVVGGPKVNEQDRAALIAAIGWCSGWRPLLTLLS